MVRTGPIERRVVTVLSDGSPRTHRTLVRETGLSYKSVENVLRRLWKKKVLLRSEKPLRKREQIFKGRGGVTSNLRTYFFYVLRPEGTNSLYIKDMNFVLFIEREIKTEKAKIIRDFLRENDSTAFYSRSVFEALKDKGVKPRDVMTTVRRVEKKGLVYVRGYRTHDRQTPFREGYLLTWIDPDKPREQALEEAIERTEKTLAERSSISPIIERIHLIRDQIIEATKLKDIIGFDYVQNKLDCSKYEAEGALKRALQLYPDLKEINLFNNFRYFHHSSMAEEDLHAAKTMKENYIRIAKGRANRIGHNWEAIAGWFVDSITTGAEFWRQNHRSNMDPRRITIHLMKPVGGRRHSAEVDRVWEVTPGPLLKPTTYVLECKWGLVRKRHVDDFLDVLRWSKEFGVDTPDGRQIKQGITGVFAGSSFDPRENVRLKDETTISLASYTARMNIQLLKAADFNEKLRERGIPKTVTVQKICRYAKDEKEVRRILKAVWENNSKSEEVLAKTAMKNKEVYDFEKMLERK
jgi:hypothetical protein